MTPEQATIFLNGLKRIQMSYPTIRYECDDLRKCIIVFTHPTTREMRIIPLRGINENKTLWAEVLQLFDEVRSLTEVNV